MRIITIAILALATFTPVTALISPAVDSDSLRAELLDEYFKEEGQTLTKDQIEEIMLRYFVKDLEHLERAKLLQEPTEQLEEADSDILGSYTVVVSYLKNNDVSDKGRADFEKILLAKTLMDYAHRNIEEVLRELLLQEMDRQGITDEEQRQKTLDDFSREANAEIDEINRMYGDGPKEEEDEKEEQQEDL